jgi:hypothetical protein
VPLRSVVVGLGSLEMARDRVRVGHASMLPGAIALENPRRRPGVMLGRPAARPTSSSIDLTRSGERRADGGSYAERDGIVVPR